MASPLLAALLTALAVALGFVAAWQILLQRDPLKVRLKEYGLDEKGATPSGEESKPEKRRSWSTVTRLLAGLGLGPRLANALVRADASMTAAEFAVIMIGAAAVGFVIGAFRAGLFMGVVAAVVAAFVPYILLVLRGSRRQQAFTAQLPDILTMLVGALRAGYGLSQAIEMLVDELPPPASTEFGKVMRAVSLGLPIQQALANMSDRLDSDDLAMVVTAISVQYEMGGNLAETLDTIGQTVRDRIRMLREIRVLTAQQRLTGYFLAVWPAIIGFIMFLINPSYIRRLFEPGMWFLPAAAVVMQILGFLIIRKIVDIEV